MRNSIAKVLSITVFIVINLGGMFLLHNIGIEEIGYNSLILLSISMYMACVLYGWIYSVITGKYVVEYDDDEL